MAYFYKLKLTYYRMRQPPTEYEEAIVDCDCIIWAAIAEIAEHDFSTKQIYRKAGERYRLSFEGKVLKKFLKIRLR